MFVFGIRYVDDIILRVRDANASGPPEERRYYLTDANYNVVMRTDDSGRGIERMYYSAYGQPECFPFGDVTGDYVVDTADATALATIVNLHTATPSSGINILADLNLDGVITQADLNLLNANYLGHTGGSNVLSVDTEANDIGYAGYIWNDETTQWHVRNRELSPKLGRWLQRDPARFADNFNLYLYAGSNPIIKTDPTGKFAVAGCLIGGGVGGVVQGFRCGIRFWDHDRNCYKEGVCAALAGCVEGSLIATFPGPWTGCLAGAAASIVNLLCNRGWDCIFGNKCDWGGGLCEIIDLIVNSIAGCIGGGGARAKDAAIDWITGVLGAFLGTGAELCMSSYANTPSKPKRFFGRNPSPATPILTIPSRPRRASRLRNRNLCG